MAKVGDIKIKVDRFFTDTRLNLCSNIECRFNDSKNGDLLCILKKVHIGRNGQCIQSEKRSNEK